MSKQAEADLILKLYEIRREAKMREARDWYFREFNPESMSDIKNVMFSAQSAHFRMVASYWEMAAALVNHGAIDSVLFDDTNAEHFPVYAKVEPFLEEYRGMFGPGAFKNLQELIEGAPGGKERLALVKQRLKAMRDQAAGAATKSA